MIQLVAQKTGASIRKVCAVLGAARSSFYHAAAPTALQVADASLGELIEIVIDLCSRRIVGWSLQDHMRSDLVLDALRQATQTRHASCAIFHSDRGSQYGSALFRNALAKAGLRQSMSARANPYDNAWTESFFGTLKHEMLQGGCFENATDARTEIFEYIEGYYNTHRKHSSLGYQTPSQFEAHSHSSN